MTSLPDDIVAEIEQRRFQLNVNLLKVYNYYRVFVGLALLAMFLQHYTETRLGSPAARDVPVGRAVLHRHQSPQRDEHAGAAGAILQTTDPGRAVRVVRHHGAGVADVSVGRRRQRTRRRDSRCGRRRRRAGHRTRERFSRRRRDASSCCTKSSTFRSFRPTIAATTFRPASSVRSTSRRRLRFSRFRPDYGAPRSRRLSRAAEVADLERVNRSIIQRMRTGHHRRRQRRSSARAESIRALAARPRRRGRIGTCPAETADRTTACCGAPTRTCAPDRSKSRRPRRRSARTSAPFGRNDPTRTSSSSSKTRSKFSSRPSNSNSRRWVGCPRASRTKSAIRSVRSVTRVSCSANPAISTRATRV